MWKKELKSIVHNKVTLVVLVALALIPIYYGAVFLGSLWDPYSKLDQLQVAVVNLDKAADMEGEKINVGTELADNLKKSDSLGFNIVSEKKAKDGMRDGDYYMVITIPKNFSKNATTLLSDDPEKMNLNYETNPGKNLIVGTISDSAAKTVAEQVRAEVTETYATAVFASLSKVGEGLTTAGAGSGEVTDGAEKLADGSQTITTNLDKLADSTLTFSDGADTLSSGLGQYLAGVSTVNDGAQTLNNGLQTLNGKTGALVDGASQLSNGSQTLQSGVSSYTSGVAQASAGASKLQSNSQTLLDGSNELSTKVANELVPGTKQLADGASTLAAGASDVATGVAKTQSSTKDLEGKIKELHTGAKAVADGASQVSTGVNQLQTAIPDAQQLTDLSTALAGFSTLSAEQQQAVLAQMSTLVAGLQSASSQVSTLAQGASDTAAGAKEVSSSSQLLDFGVVVSMGSMNKLVDGANQVSAGAATASAGATKLADSSTTLATGAEQLNNGVKAYVGGTNSVASGLSTINSNSQKLVSGATSLSNGLTSLNGQMPSLTSGVAQLADGSSQIANGTDTLVGKNAELTSGVTQLADGATQINSGSAQLATGSSTLTTGLGTLIDGSTKLTTSLNDNGKTVSDSSTTTKNEISMFSTPVNLTKTQHSKVNNYGAGLAPYFLSVAMFVGALSFNVLYAMDRSRGRVTSAKELWKSKMIVMTIQGVAQAVLVVLIMKFALGIQTASLPQFFLIAILSSMASMAIVTWLNVQFGTIGKGLSMLVLVLQLGSAAGTFPIETSNKFYEFLHPLLPISYSVEGLRQAFFGGQQPGIILHSSVILLAYIVVFSVFMYFSYNHKVRRNEIEELEDIVL